jgi:DNA-directed RNA polymerase specialized sigma24 family protein
MLYFDIDEPSYNDIARELSMPVASVGPTRARCLEKLKRLLDA